MCTGVRFADAAGNLYFGRNLDWCESYGEGVVITPRGASIPTQFLGSLSPEHACVGMGIVVGGVPCYFDCANEAGLAIAGLNFPGYAQFAEAPEKGAVNVAAYEFPLWVAASFSTVAEVRKALEDGCNEIDMVVNISDVKNGLLDKVEEEIRTLKKECGHHILKVIIETCYLTEEEKIAMCKAVTNAGADFIKTSTGFGTGGATKEDVELFKKYIGPNVKIKAAGGVSSMEDLEMFLELGCERIGTSRAVGLCKGELTEGY